MANGKLLRQLIRSGLQGDLPNFRAASEAVIAEEREKKHHLLANDLEKLMYGTQSASTQPLGHLKLVSSMPSNKDSGLSLLELRPVVREQQDIVLSDVAKSALEEIIQEHNRADLLRSFGLKPAQKLLFFGPPGCGKTL
ncbi:MAG: ATP-binding protein, partial [Polaromonas sp.]|nr:ATP-binding protein [Polaromonas sp.]